MRYRSDVSTHRPRPPSLPTVYAPIVTSSSVAEGKALAATVRCKYVEVSAMLALQLDDLLVSLTRDLCRTRLARPLPVRGAAVLSKAATSIVRRFLRRGENRRSISHDSAL